MPGTNTVVRELILHDVTLLGVLRQAAELTALPLDDLLPDKSLYHYAPGSHRLLVIETDYTEGFTQEDCFVLFLHLYSHEDRKNPGFLSVHHPEGHCPNCDSEFVFYTYGKIHCKECGAEVDC